MSEVICNTSPLQYLHQLGLLHVLPALAGKVIVPPAVIAELAVGRALHLNLPDPSALAWVDVRSPLTIPVLANAADLGQGETEVLALASETKDAEVLLDDRAARVVAETLGIRLRGTLGVLLDAKRAALIPSILPVLDQLRALGFHLHPKTRAEILKRAGE